MSCIKQLPRSKTVVDINSFCTIKLVMVMWKPDGGGQKKLKRKEDCIHKRNTIENIFSILKNSQYTF
jgi:hypothetical protein